MPNLSTGALASLLLFCWASVTASAFVPVPLARFHHCKSPVSWKNYQKSFLVRNAPADDTQSDWELDDEELEILFEDSELEFSKELDNTELAWRYAKKPLLRIGSKGATLTHGNSLRQLLDAHTAVKVKINTRKFGTLEDAFEVIKNLAEDSGAPKGIELIQTRDAEKTILCGLPGTLEKIERGEFPPPAENGKSEDEEAAPGA